MFSCAFIATASPFTDAPLLSPSHPFSSEIERSDLGDPVPGTIVGSTYYTYAIRRAEGPPGTALTFVALATILTTLVVRLSAVPLPLSSTGEAAFRSRPVASDATGSRVSSELRIRRFGRTLPSRRRHERASPRRDRQGPPAPRSSDSGKAGDVRGTRRQRPHRRERNGEARDATETASSTCSV